MNIMRLWRWLFRDRKTIARLRRDLAVCRAECDTLRTTCDRLRRDYQRASYWQGVHARDNAIFRDQIKGLETREKYLENRLAEAQAVGSEA